MRPNPDLSFHSLIGETFPNDEPVTSPYIRVSALSYKTHNTPRISRPLRYSTFSLSVPSL